jgi:hypothetical protein
MNNGESFMQVLEYQKLKYSLEQQGVIKPDNSNIVYIVIAFFAGGIVGSILPW